MTFMKVKKRDSRLQEFNLDKIKRTICNASDDIREPMTEGDLNFISDDIEEKVMKRFKDVVLSIELRKIIIETLNELGFRSVSESYENAGKLEEVKE